MNINCIDRYPELQKAFDTINAHILDARVNLGTEVFHFVSSLTPIVNVDLLIKNELGETLLTWRSDELYGPPYGPGWHLPGGVVRYKEDPKIRVPKVALSELGCEVMFEETPLTVTSQISDTRVVRGHFISLLYRCVATTPPKNENKADKNDPLNGQWFWHRHAPEKLLPAHETFRTFINER